MTLGWIGDTADDPAPTEAELAALAVLAVDLHADGVRRWCCRDEPCGQLAWAQGFLAARTPVTV